MFQFGGRCDYVLSEDHCGNPGGTFRIQAENVACGTTGGITFRSRVWYNEDNLLYF